jgi:hypothetical protein
MPNVADEDGIAKVVTRHRERVGRLDASSPNCVVPEIVFQRPGELGQR